MIKQIDWRAKQPTHGLFLGRSEVFRSLRHYLREQSQAHSHTIDRLEEKGVDTGSASRSSLKGRQMAIVRRTRIGTAGNLGETSERRGGAHVDFFERIDSILN